MLTDTCKYQDHPVMMRRFYELAALPDLILNHTKAFFDAPEREAKKAFSHLKPQTLDDALYLKALHDSVTVVSDTVYHDFRLVALKLRDYKENHTAREIFAILQSDKGRCLISDANYDPFGYPTFLSEITKVSESPFHIHCNWIHWNKDKLPHEKNDRELAYRIIRDDIHSEASCLETFSFHTR